MVRYGLCKVVWGTVMRFKEGRCDIEWCGVVWCVVWCGVVWCSVVWCGIVHHYQVRLTFFWSYLNVGNSFILFSSSKASDDCNPATFDSSTEVLCRPSATSRKKYQGPVV